MASNVTAEFKQEFVRRRDSFTVGLRAAVAGSDEVIVCDANGQSMRFSKWTTDGWVYHTGTLEDAVQWLAYLIDQGHKVAWAVNREGARSTILLAYNGDQGPKWTPVWPPDFCVDQSRISEPMTLDWKPRPVAEGPAAH